MEAVSRIFRLALIAAGAAAAPTAYAHVLDEYLQSTLVIIEPGDIRLSIHLTPGVEIADQVLAHIDQDRDGTISGLKPRLMPSC